jgi:nicotinamidase-related amidase
MIERVGWEQLVALSLARAPDRALDAAATPSAEDAADLARVRASLADLALAAEPVAPPPRLRERLLATRPRPRRPEHPVLLVLDMIHDHLAPGGPLEVPRARDIVPALSARLAGARAKGVPVVYVCDAHDEGDPDYGFWPMHALNGTEGAAVWHELAPQPGDRVVTKPTYSAFQRSELGPMLEEMRADELVITGCATELGIHATAVDALQRGYVVTIPPDCQAGVSALAEQVTMLTLSTMPPYDPIYLRKRA